MRAWVVGGLALAIGMTGLAQAADLAAKPDDIIAGRQAGYDVVSGMFAAMKATVESGGSVKPLAEGAKGIAAWGAAIPGMFPVGTETGHNTKAKAEIWSDRATFEKDAANLHDAAVKLAALADADDKAGFAEQWKATGGTCGACHRAFRAR